MIRNPTSIVANTFVQQQIMRDRGSGSQANFGSNCISAVYSYYFHRDHSEHFASIPGIGSHGCYHASRAARSVERWISESLRHRQLFQTDQPQPVRVMAFDLTNHLLEDKELMDTVNTMEIDLSIRLTPKEPGSLEKDMSAFHDEFPYRADCHFKVQLRDGQVAWSPRVKTHIGVAPGILSPFPLRATCSRPF